MQANCIQATRTRSHNGARRQEFTALNLAKQIGQLEIGEGRLACQEAVEHRAQAVNVARRPERVEPARCLFGAHVGGSADPRTHLGGLDVAARLRNQSAIRARRRQVGPPHALG